ncbi:MAG: hypothetical protein ACYC4R_02705 [Anaerolineae bacterium]
MFNKIIRDGHVSVAFGLFCASVALMLSRWAGSAAVDFIQGFFTGIALVAFGLATVVFVLRARAPETPAVAPRAPSGSAPKAGATPARRRH